MKRVFLFILLMYIPLMVSAKANYLYDVLKDEAESNGLATEYIGEHHDSFLEEPSKKIYHWHSDTELQSNQILEKNNVIFGNLCWQMIRTTDTGGVKLLYNGEVVDNKCSSSRGNHVGYSYLQHQSLLDSYYYGTSYIYDKENNTFKLDGDITTGSIDVGKYTCRSTSQNDSCSTIYLVFSIYSGREYYLLAINNNSKNSQFGTLPYNIGYYYPLNVGYSFEKKYYRSSKSTSSVYVQDSAFSINDNYLYYGNEVIYDEGTNKYSLVDAQLIADLADLSELVGKYVLSSKTNQASSSAYYVVKKSDDRFLYRRLSNGDLYTKIVCGSSYTKNDDETFTINNPNLIDYSEWIEGEKTNCEKKYACLGSSASCDNIHYIVNTSSSSNYFYSYSYKKTGYKYGEGVKYENGIYTLTGTIKTIWNTFDNENRINFIGHHYTCLSATSTTCEKVAYVFSIENGYIYYIELEGESNIEEVLQRLFEPENDNLIDSVVKTGVEAWFEKYLNDYSSFVEDTVYCNDKRVLDYGGWDPHFGNPLLNKDNLLFKSEQNKDLSCQSVYDRYSIYNSRAKLKNKVGLITASEIALIGDINSIDAGEDFWTMSPKRSGRDTAMYILDSGRGLTGSFLMDSSYGVRPVVSLKPNTRYEKGSGSTEEPYVIDYNEYYNVNVEIVNETQNFNIEIEDLTKVSEGEEVIFEVTPIKGFKINSIKILDSYNNEINFTKNNIGYSFIMPANDVTIIPSYERVSNSVNVEDVIGTKEIIIKVEEAKAVVYEDRVVFKVVPEDGYEVEYIEIIDEYDNKIEYNKTNNKNEYEFIMPDTSVTIIPSYKRIAIIDDDKAKQVVNPNTFDSLAIIITILFISIIIITYLRENKVLRY